jgi:hypothetical protein
MFVFLSGKEKIVGKLTKKNNNQKKAPLTGAFLFNLGYLLKVNFRT